MTNEIKIETERAKKVKAGLDEVLGVIATDDTNFREFREINPLLWSFWRELNNFREQMTGKKT